MSISQISANMFDADRTVKIRTFCSSDDNSRKTLPGSLQYIHLYSSKARAEFAAANSNVSDGFDHGFVYIESPGKAYVRWRNIAGEIQFCGSGAYALAWHMLKAETVTQVSLHTIHRTLIADSSGDSAAISTNPSIKGLNTASCYLSIPSFHPVEVTHFSTKTIIDGLEEAGHLYVDCTSGIYLLQLNDSETLTDTTWLGSKIEQLSSLDIHGFCAFNWDSETSSGKLRYFVPWHGRDEDYVTGSIQQYLTSLVHDKYGAQTQHWQQMSSSSGRLLSEYRDSHIRLSGQCEQY